MTQIGESMDGMAMHGRRSPLPCRSAIAAALVWLVPLHAAACIDGSHDKFVLAARWCGPSASAADGRPLQAQQLSLYGRAANEGAMPPAAAAVPPAPPAVGLPPEPPRAMPRSTRRALQLVPEVAATARAHDIDPLLLHAIAEVESRHDARAVSPAGALGLMQVMPATARRFGVRDPHRELHDVRTNLGASAAYLKWLQRRYGNDLKLVLAAYNAGEGAVEKHGRRVPPYRETQRYVREVLDRYLRWKGQQSRLAAESSIR